MHNLKFKVYHFIDKFDELLITNLDKKVNLIYRNYNSYNYKVIIKINKLCKKQGRAFYLSNDFKLAHKLNLSGVYIPSFNRSLNLIKYNKKKNFEIIGSAHNIKELKVKEKQMVTTIFLSPLFKIIKSNKFLGIVKFNNLSKETSLKTIALGGIKQTNIRKLKSLNCFGYASISFIKNNIKYI